MVFGSLAKSLINMSSFQKNQAGQRKISYTPISLTAGAVGWFCSGSPADWYLFTELARVFSLRLIRDANDT